MQSRIHVYLRNCARSRGMDLYGPLIGSDRPVWHVEQSQSKRPQVAFVYYKIFQMRMKSSQPLCSRVEQQLTIFQRTWSVARFLCESGASRRINRQIPSRV